MDVDHLQDGLTRNINRMNRLEKEITAIQKAVEELTNMEEALKGEGGQAIRDFYTSCHLPFLQYFLSFKEEFNTILQQAQQALSSLEPMDDGHIVEEFLETTVEEGLTASADITTALTDEANAIMDEVADIVGLPKLDDTLVHESIADAKTKRDDTVEALHTFDSTQTAQLLPIETSIQSMKEWVKNIEGLFQAGLTDVNFPADTWSAMASRSSLGMAIAAQQAPVGSVAHALHEQNQLTLMLQASLSNMAPIRFGFGGFAQKSYPTYGPVMLGLGNLSPGNQTSETVQQVSKSSDPDLEEIYAALAKQAEGMDVSSPSSPGTYSAKEELTYEGMRKVLGGNGSGTPDGLALYAKSMGPSAKYVFDFFTEDIRTILDPEATAVEKAMAIGFTFFKPAKLLDKAGDVAGAARDVGKAVDRGRGTGELKHPVLDNPRVGSALKDDFYHNFNDIIDNYADDAQRFDLPNKKGHMDSLYQIEGSVVKYETKYVKVKNNASEMIQTKETKDGVFEWVVDPKTNTVTHRTFIPGGKVTGKINQWGK
ncbi:ribonuclease YeeF family protein [Lysinibacillus odysseyi]|uniref:ribonuclease YeeF family protein n=1 Tax=Lysinibacillus odysseyi TaxID=202611 RepID=UPI0007ABA5BC|nr:LXG domain-containing protein [Lysinibacillus odysseyi]